MCGIAGILGAGSDEKRIIRDMTARLRHRGPDDEGLYDGHRVLLGHTRLAIIDRAGGREPFVDPEGRGVLVYNGEVYNHEALREELQAAGRRFRSRSDGEVPLHLLDHQKDPAAALGRLDGMFALAHWDEGRRRLLLARDPYGIKPLFYTATRDAFLFASEMKALLAHPDVVPRIDEDAVREKSVFEYLLPGSSLLQGIRSVPPGHFLVHEQGDVQIRRYHEPRTSRPPLGLSDAGRAIHRALKAAVAKQLMSDVPLGVILSGGLDSSLIAALQAEVSDRPVVTFSAAGSESNPDFQAARLVAEHLGTDHHEVLFTLEDMERDLADLVWSIEDIDHETYFFHPLFRAASKHATVTLCGQGADEVFAGYDRYRDLPGLRARLRDRTARAWPQNPDRHDAVLGEHYGDLQGVMAWERGAQLEQFQLRLVDRSSMAFSMEVRVPFLDEAVVATGRGLPEPLLITNGVEKAALREAARQVDLPPGITGRRKVPAGRRTAGRVVTAFENEAARRLDPGRLRAHPYGNLLEPPGVILFELFKEIFVERRGERPRGLNWTDLL